MSPIEEFLQFINNAITQKTFIGISMGNNRNGVSDIKKISSKIVLLKGEEVLQVVLHHKTNDKTQNLGFSEIPNFVNKHVEIGLANAYLWTETNDYALQISIKGKILVQKLLPTKTKEISSHNEVKNRIFAAAEPFLHTLGISNKDGIILPTAKDKYLQINQFVEILKPYLLKIGSQKPLNIADMGSGKGYLTFGIYQFLQSQNITSTVTGIEFRKDLVQFCNNAAQNLAFKHLSFLEGTIQDIELAENNVLIALHACDTATDDAIIKGIEAKADLIVVAPCCHKQIRREMEQKQHENSVTSILKNGIMLERQAEILTDTIRALVLEALGYKVKIVQFIADAHTPKNMMLIAEKIDFKKDVKLFKVAEIEGLKKLFGIKRHYLQAKLQAQLV